MSKTLTEMVINCDTHFDLDQIEAIKSVVKEWLQKIDLPDYGTPKTIQQLLAILVDEP